MRRTIISGSREGKLIGVCAASTVVDEKALRGGLGRFAGWGYATRLDESLFARERYFAGSDEERAQGVLRLLNDPMVGTLWCARGGYGATRILSLLDKARAPARMARAPKLLIGFSDVTALHFYFWNALKLGSLHAPMPGTFAWSRMPASAARELRAVLAGQMAVGKDSSTAAWRGRAWGPAKEASGVVLGGNLSLLATMVGTPWQPSLDGALLALEDCGETPYRIDRMLTQLWNAGMLRKVRGVLLGDFSEGVVYRDASEKRYLKEVLMERFAALGVPVVAGLPFGHGVRNEPLCLGVKARITRGGKLEYLERLVRG